MRERLVAQSSRSAVPGVRRDVLAQLLVGHVVEVGLGRRRALAAACSAVAWRPPRAPHCARAAPPARPPSAGSARRLALARCTPRRCSCARGRPGRGSSAPGRRSRRAARPCRRSERAQLGAARRGQERRMVERRAALGLRVLRLELLVLVREALGVGDLRLLAGVAGRCSSARARSRETPDSRCASRGSGSRTPRCRRRSVGLPRQDLASFLTAWCLNSTTSNVVGIAYGHRHVFSVSAGLRPSRE